MKKTLMRTLFNSILLFVVLTLPRLVKSQVVADFMAAPTTVCVGDAVLFTDMSMGVITSWTWTFPGGTPSSSNTPNPSVTWNTPGVYTITLTVSDGAFNDTQIKTNYITVVDNGISGFTFVTNNLQADFTDASTGATSYLWDFGDGNMSTQTNPSHTYYSPGSYVVCQTIIDGCGAADSTCQVVTVSCVNAVSGFTFLTNNLQADFTDVSTGAVSYLWDFGDGNTSTQSNPSHTYASPGSYTVCQTVVGECGSVYADSTCQVVTVSCTPPVADFSFTTNNYDANFTDLSIGAASYLWDFGDGIQSTQANPAHTYQWSNSYIVCLTIFNACGVGDSSCMVVTIDCPTPVPGFSLSANNLVVSYTNVSSNSNSYLWDFGDGNISTLSDPIHTYASSGTYVVCQTVVNSCGADSSCQVINVDCTAPVADFNYSVGTSSPDATFTDATSGGVDSYLWDFGDGNTSTLTNPSYTYASPGIYTVCLTVTNNCGLSDSTCTSVNVVCPTPIPSFMYSGSNLTYNFTDPSMAGTSYFWDFGDGNTSTDLSPSYSYADTGNYMVCVTVTNNCGSDSTCQTIVVQLDGLDEYLPLADLIIHPNPFTEKITVDFGRVFNDLSYVVVDVNGRVIDEGVATNSDSMKLKLPIPAGIYFLHISAGDTYKVAKLIKH